MVALGFAGHSQTTLCFCRGLVMSECKSCNRENDIRARLNAARSALSRPHFDGLISPNMSIEDTVDAYRQRLAAKGLGQSTPPSDHAPQTSFGWMRNNWAVTLATLICFVFSSISSFFSFSHRWPPVPPSQILSLGQAVLCHLTQKPLRLSIQQWGHHLPLMVLQTSGQQFLSTPGTCR